MSVVLAGAVLMSSGCGGPKTYLEAMADGHAALAAGRADKAERLFVVAFEKADEVGNGYRAINAANHAADLALTRGDWATAKRLYDHLLRVYPQDVANDHRLRNNLAVAEHRLGNHARARELLEEVAAKWKVMNYSPAYPMGLHMLLLRSLARVYQAEGWGASAEATYEELRRLAEFRQVSSTGIGPPMARTLQAYAAALRSLQRTNEASELERIAGTVDPERYRVYGADLFDRCERPADSPTDREYCYLEIE